MMTLFGFILLPFVENFIWGLGLGSILLVLAIYWYNNETLTVPRFFLLLFMSIVMDISFLLPLGTVLACFAISIIFFTVLKLFLSDDGVAQRYVLFSVSFFVFHTSLFLYTHQWQMGWGIIGMVIFDIIVLIVVEAISSISVQKQLWGQSQKKIKI